MPPRIMPPDRRHGWSSVTPCEHDVIALLVEGLTNPQIAGRLQVSRDTVRSHVRSILRKLEVATRAAVVREAMRRRANDYVEAGAVPESAVPQSPPAGRRAEWSAIERFERDLRRLAAAPLPRIGLYVTLLAAFEWHQWPQAELAAMLDVAPGRMQQLVFKGRLYPSAAPIPIPDAALWGRRRVPGRRRSYARLMEREAGGPIPRSGV